MPIRSEWQLAREGITLDTLSSLLHHTLLNPFLTLPLFLASRYTSPGADLSSLHTSAFKVLKAALALGVLKRAGSWLDDRVANNWVKDTYEWDKEVVVVTGGSDGIGKEVVLLLAERGVRVAVLDVQGLTYEAPPTVHYFPVDLASHPSILSACTAVKVRLGAPTILINNAGLARGKSVLAASESDIRLTFAVNTLSHYYLAQQFLPSMVEKNHGMIVTVASYAAYITAPAMVDYAASKAAALAFHEGISAELATTYKAPKVRTVVMCQNYTRTKLFEGFAGSALFAETVAEEIVKKVLRGRSAHVLMPESGWLVVSRMRGLPLWMQYGVRKRLANLMATWQGRQVEQPSVREEEEKREKEDKVGDRDDEKRGVEESGVLVPKEE